MISTLNVGNCNVAHFASPGVYTKEYYSYCLRLLVEVLKDLQPSINLILGDIDFGFTNQNDTFKFDIQFEHTLVRLGGRSVDSLVWGGVELLDGEGKYLVRIPSYDYYSGLDATIEYSLPNLANIGTAEGLSDYLRTAVYVAPVLYDSTDFVNKGKTETITMFSDNPSDRRGGISTQINATNIKGIFDKDKLQEVYKKSKILVNVHQTDHHHTFEELRVLPALCNGVLIVSEDVPLKEEIPYSDSIIWCSYEDLPGKVKEVQDNYEYYYNKVFTAELSNKIEELHTRNLLGLTGIIQQLTTKHK